MNLKFIIVLIVALFATFPASANQSCMTHREAKEYYGHQIYLHWSGDHCWGKHAKIKESAPRVSAPQYAERLPNRETAVSGADTAIWPDPPRDYSWTDRWPNERVIPPGRWLLELVQFGKR